MADGRGIRRGCHRCPPSAQLLTTRLQAVSDLRDAVRIDADSVQTLTFNPLPPWSYPTSSLSHPTPHYSSPSTSTPIYTRTQTPIQHPSPHPTPTPARIHTHTTVYSHHRHPKPTSPPTHTPNTHTHPRHPQLHPSHHPTHHPHPHRRSSLAIPPTISIITADPHSPSHPPSPSTPQIPAQHSTHHPHSYRRSWRTCTSGWRCTVTTSRLRRSRASRRCGIEQSMQDTGRRMQDSGRRMQDAGCRMQDAGRRTQDAGRRMQDAGCRTLKSFRKALN